MKPFWTSKRKKNAIVATTTTLVIVVILAFVFVDVLPQNTGVEPDVFVGVDVGFGGEQEVYKVADAIKNYANLIIIGSTALTSQTENLTRVCDYLYQQGFSFIIYIGFSMSPTGFPPKGPDPEFFNRNRERWGNSLLGMYIFDEPGGKQLDYAIGNPDKPVPKANNISDAAIHYALGVEPYTTLYRGDTYYAAQWLGLFTSDYGLYWFDHLAGYRVVLGEFAGNNSRPVTIALSRGAAVVRNRDWGTMITWKYDNPPYLEEANQLYDDMKLAYDCGAKYVVVFNSPHFTSAGPNPPITPYGILTEEHLNAMKQFWDYTKAHPRDQQFQADTAYVLPRDWGFGFRGPQDNIWGLWPADEIAPKVWNDTQALLATEGKNLDIVYETRIDNVAITLPYKTLIFWNGTIINR